MTWTKPGRPLHSGGYRRHVASPMPVGTHQYVCAFLVARSSPPSGSWLPGSSNSGSDCRRIDTALEDGHACTQHVRGVGDPGSGIGGAELGWWPEPVGGASWLSNGVLCYLPTSVLLVHRKDGKGSWRGVDAAGGPADQPDRRERGATEPGPPGSRNAGAGPA